VTDVMVYRMFFLGRNFVSTKPIKISTLESRGLHKTVVS